MQQQSIRELAYQLWLADGGVAGSADHYLRAAERQLRGEKAAASEASANAVDDALKDSFPASDPPASHLPDEPPVNAKAKFKAAASPRKK